MCELSEEDFFYFKMEVQHAETKGEEFPSYVTDKRLIGLLPMFILVLIIVLRISWTLYKSFGKFRILISFKGLVTIYVRLVKFF